MKRFLVLACVAGATATSVAQDVPLEYRVKAAFLYNFTKFVQWPSVATDGAKTFALCIAGMNPFGDVLESTIAGDAAAGRPLLARVVSTSTSGCHILFIPRSVPAGVYLREVENAPV